jgi:hypothetical protein
MRALVFTLLSFLCSASALAQLHFPERATDFGASEADLIRGITITDDPGAAQKAYRILFKKIGADGIHNLLVHTSDTIAIRAAWEEVNLTVPEMEQSKVLRPDRHKLDWFIGFLVGRVHVKPPQWWIDAMVESKANRRDNIYPDMSMKRMYHDSGLGSIRAPLDTTLTEKGGNVVLRVAGESVAFPMELLRKDDAGKATGSVSAILSPSRYYVAVHEDVGYPYRLACIDRASGKERWSAKTWGSWAFNADGVFDCWITVTEQDDRIILFGAASTGFHVEGFRSDDGRNLFRVSNTF